MGSLGFSRIFFASPPIQLPPCRGPKILRSPHQKLREKKPCIIGQTYHYSAHERTTRSQCSNTLIVPLWNITAGKRNLVKLCFSSPKITHLFRQIRTPTEDFLSNAPTQPPHSRRMHIFSHPQSAQFFVVVAACRTRDLKSILLHRD